MEGNTALLDGICIMSDERGENDAMQCNAASPFPPRNQVTQINLTETQPFRFPVYYLSLPALPSSFRSALAHATLRAGAAELLLRAPGGLRECKPCQCMLLGAATLAASPGPCRT